MFLVVVFVFIGIGVRYGRGVRYVVCVGVVDFVRFRVVFFFIFSGIYGNFLIGSV